MINAYAVQEPQGELKPYAFNPGDLKRNQVEIIVEHCGICHSDLSMMNNEWGMSEYPLVPGHEVIGTIAELGQEVNHLRVGQRVGLGWHASYCMTCNECVGGDHNLCTKAVGTIVGHHGGFADKVRAEAASVIPIPEGLNPASAGPLLCGGITVFNPLVQFAIPPTAKVGVIGIGGLGHLALQFARAWGCEVTAFTSNPEKNEEAMGFGAHHVIDSRDKAALENAAYSLDMIISTVNVSLDWNRYIGTLKPRGRLHLVGAALEPLNIAAFGLIVSQRSISGSPVGSPQTLSHMLNFAKRHNIQPKVEHFPMKDVNNAIEHLASGNARYRVVLDA